MDQWKPEPWNPIQPDKIIASMNIYTLKNYNQMQSHEIPIGSNYQLNEQEMAECIRIGQERTSKNFYRHVDSNQYYRKTQEANDIQGVLGEYSFCRLFKLPILIYDTSCRTALKERHFDAFFPNGWTVDVKTISTEDELKVGVWKKNNPPSLYALMKITHPANNRFFTIEEPCCLSFMGFCSASDVFNLKHWSHQKSYNTFDYCYTIPNNVLQPLSFYIHRGINKY